MPPCTCFSQSAKHWPLLSFYLQALLVFLASKLVVYFLQVIRCKHKIRAFSEVPRVHKGKVAGLALALANNMLEVSSLLHAWAA